MSVVIKTQDGEVLHEDVDTWDIQGGVLILYRFGKARFAYAITYWLKAEWVRDEGTSEPGGTS